MEKAFKSNIEINKLYSAVVKNVVAETNDFFKHLLLLAAFNVGGNFFIFPEMSSLYIGSEWITEQGFDANAKPYNKWNSQTKFIIKDYLQNLLWL